jgi:hypothetical protein
MVCCAIKMLQGEEKFLVLVISLRSVGVEIKNCPPFEGGGSTYVC